MAGSNGTTEDESSLTYQQIFKLDIDIGLSTKTAVAVLTCLFFCFVNCVMLFCPKKQEHVPGDATLYTFWPHAYE